MHEPEERGALHDGSASDVGAAGERSATPERLRRAEAEQGQVQVTGEARLEDQVRTPRGAAQRVEDRLGLLRRGDVAEVQRRSGEPPTAPDPETGDVVVVLEPSLPHQLEVRMSAQALHDVHDPIAALTDLTVGQVAQMGAGELDHLAHGRLGRGCRVAPDELQSAVGHVRNVTHRACDVDRSVIAILTTRRGRLAVLHTASLAARGVRARTRRTS